MILKSSWLSFISISSLLD